MARAIVLPIIVLLAATTLSACATTTSTSPAEVTRFTRAETVTPDSVMVIGVEGSAPGAITPASMEAVGRELGAIGFTSGFDNASRYDVSVSVEQGVGQGNGRGGSGVNVGVGGSTGWGHGRGGWGGSGVGVGVGLDLTSLFAKPKTNLNTRLSVSIKDRTSGTVVWEGRAENSTTVTQGTDPSPQIASKLANALFKGFPGKSGETIVVK